MNKATTLTVAAIALFAGGAAVGFFADRFDIAGLGTAAHDADPHDADDDHAEDADDAHDDHEGDHEDHIGLTAQAVANLGLAVEPVERAEFSRLLRIPGEVVELPGYSVHVLAAPVNGIVERALAAPGMAVSPGDAVFQIQVVDEAIFAAQIELLDTITRLEIVDAELTRLGPLASSGTVAGRRKLDLDYERKQLVAKREVRIQELLARGLTEQHVQHMMETNQLVRRIVLRVPERQTQPAELRLLETAAASPDGGVQPAGFEAYEEPGEDPHKWEFALERLRVAPGQTVSRGEALCDLAHHAQLYIQGQAFESEIDAVVAANDKQRSIAAEFGVAGHEERREGLQIRYVANHVDPETQTFLFYLPLANEVVRDAVDAAGQTYRSWRFKVGQRVHIQVPVEQFDNCLRVPVAAVVEEGANAFVFREHVDADEDDHADHADDESADLHDEEDHHEEDFAIELEPVPVAIEMRDQDYVVLADDGQIAVGDHIAMNSAYQLLLAFKAQSEEGGGGHHHHHH